MDVRQLKVRDTLQFNYNGRERRVIIGRKYITGICCLIDDGVYKNFNFNKMENIKKIVSIPINNII